MKKMMIWIPLLLMSSCALKKVPFTHLMKRSLEQRGVPLKNVVFYNDRTMFLYREIQNASEKQPGAAVRKKQGKLFEYIIIPRMSPATFSAAENGEYIVLYWQSAADGIQFQRNADGEYQVTAKLWKDGNGLIDYRGKEYYLSDISGYTKVLVRNTEVQP